MHISIFKNLTHSIRLTWSRHRSIQRAWECLDAWGEIGSQSPSSAGAPPEKLEIIYNLFVNILSLIRLPIPILSPNNIVQAPGLSEAGTWREPWGPQCTCSSSLEQDTRSQTSPFLVAAYITKGHKHSFSHLHKKYDIVKRHWFSMCINVNLPNVKVSKGPSISWGALGIVGPIRVCLVVWK